MDRDAAGEALARRGDATGDQAVIVAEIGIKRLHRLGRRRLRRQQAERTHQAVGVGEGARLVPVSGGAERGAEVLGAPCQAVQAGERRPGEIRQAERRAGGLGGDRQDADAAWGEAFAPLHDVQIVAQPRHVGAAVDLRDHDAGQARPHDAGQVLDPALVQRVDPDPVLRPGLVCRQILRDHSPGQRLAGRRDRVLEVQDECVGPGAGAAAQLLLAVAGHEQEGAQDHAATGFLRCRPERLQWPTSSLRWL